MLFIPGFSRQTVEIANTYRELELKEDIVTATPAYTYLQNAKGSGIAAFNKAFIFIVQLIL